MIKNRTQYARQATDDLRWTKVNGSFSGQPVPGTLGPVLTSQSTVTEGHPISLLGSGLDIGGFFQTTKRTYSESGAGPFNLYQKGGIIERGVDNAYAYPSNLPKGTTWPVACEPSSLLELWAYGATAIARTIPTNPHADITTFLGELRAEGLPSMVGRNFAKRPNPRTAAGEYLNWQFGLMPILADFKQFGQSFLNKEAILEQLLKDAGKRVRRRYNFPTETIVEGPVTNVQYSFPAYDTNLYGGSGVRTIETTTTINRWFSGCYSYQFPEGDTLLGLMQGFEAKAHRLAGLPSVESLWNLTPWSWAVDWFSNAGDVMHNLAAFSRDGLVMHYGYIMEHKKVSQKHTYSGTVMVGNKPIAVRSQQIFGAESKVRVAASPFGFGLTWGDLTLRQKSIAVALGISRAPSL